MTKEEFLLLTEERRRVLEEFPLPVLLCDTAFTVLWTNGAARLRCPELIGEEDLRRLLAEFRPEELSQTIEDHGCVTLNDAMPLRGAALTLTLLRPDGAAIGYEVTVLEAGIPHPSQRSPRSSGSTAEALAAGIREGANGIFSAMDAAYLKAAMLEGASWLGPHLNRISIHAYRMLRTASNVAEYAKLQNGALDIRLEPVDLFDMLREAEGPVTELCRSLSVGVSFRVPEGIGLLRLDEARVELAFYNVLYNSLSFGGEHNEIVVEAAHGERSIFLTVTDKGPGIPPERLERVLEPYYASNEAGQAGTGLGLTLAKRLTEAQGGVFTLRSSPGMGTTAEFAFPATGFSRALPLAQADRPSAAASRFSQLYVGLVGVLDKPYGNQDSAGKQ